MYLKQWLCVSLSLSPTIFFAIVLIVSNFLPLTFWFEVKKLQRKIKHVKPTKLSYFS